MLFWLSDYSAQFSVLNLFRYITFRAGGATVTALFFVLMFGPSIITLLRIKQGKGQPIRTDGPESHLAKRGTPTMGGLMILSGLLVASLLWCNLSNPFVWSVLGVTVGFGAIGFYDDYLKVSKQSHKGFSSRARLGLEALIAGIATYVIVRFLPPTLSSVVSFPIFKEAALDIGMFFIVFGMFMIVAAGNAVNLTDGLDGLAIVPVMIAAGTFGFIAYLAGNAIFANYLQINFVPRVGELWVMLALPVISAFRMCRVLASLRSSVARWSAQASASCGSMRRPRRSSWAIPDRWRWVACSAPWLSPPSTRSSLPSWAGCSCWRR